MLQSSRETKPRYAKCGTVMEQASVQPGLARFSYRIFKCERCDVVEMVPEIDPMN
jgi:hypothetical protein